jgi:hypothetical protein
VSTGRLLLLAVVLLAILVSLLAELRRVGML